MRDGRLDGPPLDLDGRSLRYFVVVADELNFTRAAKRLHVAQQTLSDSVRQLESLIGVRLLERSTRAVTLTPAGQRFLDSARSLLDQGDAAVLAARQAQRSVEQSLVIGTPDWPAGIERFRVALDVVHSDSAVTVELSAIPWLYHLAAVESGLIDVGVTFTPDRDRLPEALSAASLGVERANCFVVSSSHRLAAAVEPGLADLAQCRLLLIDRNQFPALHDHLVEGLRARGVEPDLDVPRAATMTFSAALTQAGLHGSAVWAVKSTTESLPPGLVAVEIAGLDLDVEAAAVWRTGDDNPAVENFVNALVER